MLQTCGGKRQSVRVTRWLAVSRRLISASVLKAHFVITPVTLTRRMYRDAEQVEHVVRGALDHFRSTEVSGDVHEEGSGGGERWNYASVHLTECDESNRNSTSETESGAEPSE